MGAGSHRTKLLRENKKFRQMIKGATEERGVPFYYCDGGFDVRKIRFCELNN